MNTLSLSQSARISFAVILTISILALVPLALRVHAQTVPSVALANHQLLSGQLSMGSTGSDVSELQSFLATNTYVYPLGIVSVYYGPLTADAVSQFQIAYGLPPVGNVGPLTLAKINALLSAGVTTLDVNAPIISNIQVSNSGSTAVVTWVTNETAFGKVHYDSQPIVMNETSTAMAEPVTSGTLAAESAAGTSHSVTLSGLVSGQTYSFIAEATDASGNISVSVPMTFTH